MAKLNFDSISKMRLEKGRNPRGREVYISETGIFENVEFATDKTPVRVIVRRNPIAGAIPGLYYAPRSANLGEDFSDWKVNGNGENIRENFDAVSSGCSEIFTLPAKTVDNLIRFAYKTEDPNDRTSIQCFHFTGEKLIVADGFKLVMRNFVTKFSGDVNFLFFQAALTIALRTKQDTMTFCVRGNQIIFSYTNLTGESVLVSAGISQENYPNVNMLLVPGLKEIKWNSEIVKQLRKSAQSLENVVIQYNVGWMAIQIPKKDEKGEYFFEAFHGSNGDFPIFATQFFKEHTLAMLDAMGDKIEKVEQKDDTSPLVVYNKDTIVIVMPMRVMQ